MHSNPLLDSFNSILDTFPFSKVQPKDFEESIPILIKETEHTIDDIANNNEPANFNNTIKELEQSGNQLSRITSAFFNLNAAETNADIQKIAQKLLLYWPNTRTISY